ncbi:hypothetical protein ACWD1Z_14045 [Streptomyces sp. NPDC002784]
MTEDSVQPCPVPDAHRRLMDCHAQWHLLHESYYDPDEFRLNLNSLVPNLRNVTWLLQKQKAVIPDFGTWYPQFQQSAGSSEIMKWVVKSRNRITKESDLELLSSCRVIWIRDWLQRAEGTASFPPRKTTPEILMTLHRNGVPPVGTVTLKRRWVDKALPDWELLAATSEAYSRLERLLWTAHEAFGIERCDLPDRSLECVTSKLTDSSMRLPCMHVAQSDLQTHVSMSGGFIEEETEPFELDPEKLEVAAARYGELAYPESGAIENVPGFMAMARTVMERDGFHGTFALLYRGQQQVAVQALEFHDQQQKILTFERLADLVESTRADGIVIIGESWIANQTAKEKELNTVFFPARDRLDRMECLTVYAVTRDGRHAELVSMVERGENGETRCAEPMDVSFEAGMNTMVPIKLRWADMQKRGL